MRAARPLLLFPLFLSVAASPGVGPPPRPAKDGGRAAKIAAAPPALEARLEDGSVVRLQLVQEHVRITTAYGALKVPSGDVTLIELRPRPVEDLDKRVAAAVRRLKHEKLAERLRGRKELLALGAPSYLALGRAAKGNDLDVVEQAKVLIKQLEERYPKEELERKPYDVIHTAGFSMPGRIDDATLKVATTYFGEHSLKLSSFKSLRAVSPHAATFLIDAARYARRGERLWLETTVKVRSGARLHVTARGEIDLTPKGDRAADSDALVGPGGSPNFSTDSFPAGALVGRVGERGKELLLGERYSAAPEGEGKLYLRIVPAPWRGPVRGSFRVTVWVE